MYLEHWYLREKPFENTPDPKFMYYAKGHEEALIRLLYATKELKGSMLLTGGYGCGKTVLSRVFLNELIATGKYEIALVTNPKFSANELLAELIYQLGGGETPGKNKVELLQLFNNLVYKNLARGKETVVIVDEAQAIDDLDSFEELRLLLNFQRNDRFLLTLILVGQPELRDKLKKLPQLRQRLLIGYHLDNLDEDDTYGYIYHRLSVAGTERAIFTAEAVREIYRSSNGIPRVINGMADLALLKGCMSRRTIIDAETVTKVARDINLDQECLV
ncbi:MAG: AAA family ATPase [Candidatus Omnitrophica bacterium]|nr:AAA family ATPase [Candidatus Omnitrophota bacterium]